MLQANVEEGSEINVRKSEFVRGVWLAEHGGWRMCKLFMNNRSIVGLASS